MGGGPARVQLPRAPRPRAGYDEFERLVGIGHYADWSGKFTDALLAYWNGFVEFCERTDAEHRAECTDPECDAVVCRAARGLPPLTDAELQPGRIEGAARRERKQRERDEFARKLRDHEMNERINREEE